MSTVPELAGLTVEGRAAMSHAVNVWFHADLSQYLTHRPGVLTWFVPSEGTAKLQLLTLICHRPFTEFVLVLRYDPAVDDISTWGIDRVRPYVEAAVGAAVPDLELLGIAGTAQHDPTDELLHVMRVILSREKEWRAASDGRL